MGKLEGPKKHHDDHGIDASNPAVSKSGGSPAPSGHWEKRYSTCDTSEAMKVTQGSDFIAKRGRDRKTTHLKINECDH